MTTLDLYTMWSPMQMRKAHRLRLSVLINLKLSIEFLTSFFSNIRINLVLDQTSSVGSRQFATLLLVL